MSNRLRVMLSKVIAGLRGHADRELAAEVAHHLALLEERYLARGMTPDDARRSAPRLRRRSTADRRASRGSIVGLA